jgi:hypothetical protein
MILPLMPRSCPVVPVTRQIGTQNQESRQRASEGSEQYSMLALANGRAGDGTVLSMRVYEGRGGIKVTIAHGHFKSRAAAKVELDRQVKHEGKILERASRTDAFGKVIGERVVAQLSATDSLPERFAVLLTDGLDYYEVSSPSLEMAVDLAKQGIP